MYNNGSSWATLAPGIEGQVLKMSSSGLPVWGTNNIFTCGQSIVTDIDNNNYNTVLIGNQCWTRENLRVTRYNDGTPIHFDNFKENPNTWKNLTIGAYTTYEPDYEIVPTHLYLYGYIYNWYAASGIITSGGTSTKNICPTGWHVPTNEQWVDLTNQFPSESEGGKLKSTTYHWAHPNTGADNSSGFTALPAGSRENDFFYNINYTTFFWSTSESHFDLNLGLSLGLNTEFSEITDYFNPKARGGSIRCLVLVSPSGAPREKP
jgi:uncharacterized protein (TIGR02145 family)